MQHEQGRVLGERAGEGHPLPLAAREGRSALADRGLPALGQDVGELAAARRVARIVRSTTRAARASAATATSSSPGTSRASAEATRSTSSRSPSGEWATPRTLESDPLVGALMLHLTEGVPTPRRRALCRQLLAEILGDLAVVRDAVALPRDARARAVAARLLDDPADGRELDAWAAELGVSSKTLARAFAQGTGTTFRDWRVNARLHAATRHLADGAAVQEAASRVGYTSVSSFIAAFRRRFGVTPARYAADLTRAAPGGAAGPRERR